VHPTALDEDHQIKLVERVRSLKRLLHDHSIDFVEKVLVEWLVIDSYVTCTRSEKYAGRCCFPATRTVVLY
jgi:hypothetical protein